MTDAALHAAIIGGFLAQQRAPTVRELAAQLAAPEVAVRGALRGLAERHGVVLHPGSDEVWVAHPFSAAPTTFVVRAGARRWWGNCAWCSLGVAQLAGGSAVIETRLGALDAPVAIRIEDGVLRDPEYVVHFPIPMRAAWDNVVFTCSVMLLFRDAREVDAWCAERGLPRGDVRPLAQVWSFAAAWYAHHAAPDWRKWTQAEAAALFEQHGLRGPIWDLGERVGGF